MGTKPRTVLQKLESIAEIAAESNSAILQNWSPPPTPPPPPPPKKLAPPL